MRGPTPFAAIVAVAAALFLPVSGPAQSEFFQGKQIRLVIGAFPGGGYDIYARLIARHMARFIPGNPTIVPQNLGGAAGARAAANIEAQAPKDGTTIGALLPGNVLEPLLGDRKQSNFDPSKFIYLGSASDDVFMCIIRSDAPVKSFKEAFTHEVILGATGDGGSNKNFPAMLDNVLGTKFRLVTGYPGSREVTLAIEKSEVQGYCGMSWSSVSTARPDWIPSGFMRILVQEHAKGHPIMNKMGVPLAVDFAKSAQDRQIMELVYSQATYGRPYVLPAGVPADRVAILRKAFTDTLADAEFLAEAAKLKLDIGVTSGADLQDLVARIYATPPNIVELAREAQIYKPPK